MPVVADRGAVFEEIIEVDRDHEEADEKTEVAENF